MWSPYSSKEGGHLSTHTRESRPTCSGLVFGTDKEARPNSSPFGKIYHDFRPDLSELIIALHALVGVMELRMGHTTAS